MVRDATADAAHDHFWQTSDTQLIALLLIGWRLDHLYPLSFAATGYLIAVRAVGTVLAVAGIVIWQWTRWYLKKYEQPDGPWKPTTTRIESGPFAYSRNPIYVGIATLMLGLALACNMPWWLFLLPAYIAVLYFVQIVPEEKYLARKFPQACEAYRGKVGRWV